MSEQLTFEVEAEARMFTCCSAPCPTDRQSRPSDHAADCTNPNLWMFEEDGSPKRLLWCSDDARIRGVCPYRDNRMIGGVLVPPLSPRFMPKGGCCHDLVRS